MYCFTHRLTESRSSVIGRFAVVAALLTAATAMEVSAETTSSGTGQKMGQSAARFVATLTPELKKKVHYAYDDPERVNWHFIPRERNGVGLWDLVGESRAAAEDLVKAGLSAAGYEKTLQVRSLEEVLYLFEGGTEAERRVKRHPHKYFVTVFGEPGEKGLWGWRFEGHHMSLNFSVKDGVIVSSTPEFFGANPGVLEGGPGRSLRILGRREDLARDILKACTEAQKKSMWISMDAPDDIRGAGVEQPVVSEAVGLRYADMSREQQGLLRELIGEYLSAMPVEVVKDRMQAIEKSGMDDIRIGWWGGPDRNQRHHYVIQGSSFIIEYNNTQNEANHVHAMWRNLGGDFNRVKP
jgi:hypothetical protein